MRNSALIIIIGLLGACGPTAEAGLPIPHSVPPGSNWLDVPWPSDLRRQADGHPNLRSYPDPNPSDLMRSAMVLAQKSDGFALQPTLYAGLNHAIDPAQLAADPETTMTAEAPVQLLALDGPAERRPLALAQGGGGDWMPANTLHARPLIGWPLRPASRYALVLTRSLRAAGGEAFAAVPQVRDGLNGDGALAEHLQPLADRLDDFQLTANQILLAAVFTTADPGAELRQLAAAQDAMAPPSLSEPWQAVDGQPGVLTSRYPGLLWQWGDKPYTSSGGGFRFEGGEPQLADDSEPMEITMAVGEGDAPPGGRPVIIYQHGTGGDHDSFLGGAGSLVQRWRRAGISVVGIAQPLHGARAVPGTNTELHTFNPFNLEASAANLRQGALDALLLTRMIAAGRLDRPGEAINPDNIAFFGHSQGGLTGAIALPLADGFGCTVLSGAGAGLSYTLLERKDPIDIAEAILGWAGSEGPLFPSHPLISLIQHAFEPSDPISAAPQWQAAAPHPMLVTSGLNDVQTPAVTADAMAMAALLPQLEPMVTPLWRQEMEGIDPASGPLQDNHHGVTAAYRQSRGGDHFVVFDSEAMGRLVSEFFSSCAAGEPILGRR